MITTVIITFSTCTKFGKNITVKGRVLNPITGEGYAGAIITLKKPSVSLKYNGPGDKPFKEVKTDENGYFEISAMRLSTHITAVCGYGGYQEYYTLGWSDNGKYTYSLVLDKGKTMHVDYHLVPYGGIQLIINNVNCHGITDHFILYAEGTQYDSKLIGKMIDESGCYYYNPNSFSKVPMGARYYRYEVTRDGVTTVFRDTVFIGKNEQKIYEINY
jgi:hypothetical protein